MSDLDPTRSATLAALLIPVAVLILAIAGSLGGAW